MKRALSLIHISCKEYLDTFQVGATNGAAADKLVEVLSGCDCDTCKEIVKNKDFLAKKSQWIFGGDGWAYDIGFGGLDHVIASGAVSYTHLYVYKRQGSWNRRRKKCAR